MISYRTILNTLQDKLLLDAFPGAAAAYSLRLLRKDYTGPCIRVRRSSDNAEQDIGFAGKVLDTASLLSFVGAGNGFVRTWYEQSGSGSPELSNSSNSEQPIIVNSGFITNDVGKPAINFNLTSSCLKTPPFNLSGIFSFYICTSFYSTTQRRLTFSEYSNLKFFLFPDTGSASSSSSNPNLTNAFINGINENVGTRAQARSAMLGKAMIISINNYNISTYLNYEIGRSDSATITALDYYKEVIIYPGNQTSNRIAIENNINKFYNIY